MDSEVKIQEIKDFIEKYCNDRDWNASHTPKDLAIGIITESSELLEHFRFRNEAEVADYLKNPEKKAEVEDEMADVLYFLCRLAQKNNIDLSEAFKKKMQKNESRYSVEKVMANKNKV